MKGLGSFRSPDPVAVNAPSGAAACPVLIVVRISNNLHALVCGTGVMVVVVVRRLRRLASGTELRPASTPTFFPASERSGTPPTFDLQTPRRGCSENPPIHTHHRHHYDIATVSTTQDIQMDLHEARHPFFSI